jgi:sugar transferase (PEP-CTERM system associated)
VYDLSRRSFPGRLVLQLGVELCCLFIAVLLTLRFAAKAAVPMPAAYCFAFVFALLIVCLNAAFGLYGRAENRSFGDYALRFVLAPAIAIPLAYVIADDLPGGGGLQQHVAGVGLSALGGLIIVRHAIILPLVRAFMPNRVLVLGTGPEARLVEASLATAGSKGSSLIGFYGLANGGPVVVAPNRVIAAGRPLEELVQELRIDEVIVAARQQRGGVLPLRSLLECRLNGVKVTDLPRFFERIDGRIPIELVRVSWLIYGNGYRQGWVRTFIKRTFDVTLASIFLVLMLPLMAIAAALITAETGTPVIYRQTRVGRRGKHFTVLKFRSMGRDAETGNGAQWADANDPRVTRVGRLLRRTRIDELPQLINVLRGEMSFVGPRPERPKFVAMLSEQLPFYAVRHSVNPGITGWAQVRYSYGATVEQSMKKLEYDLYYVKNHSLALDFQILLETFRVVLSGDGAR